MKKKRWIGWLGNLLILCLAVVAIYVLSFGSALVQEKDTFFLVLAAARMEITGSDIGNVGHSNQRWLVHASRHDAPIKNYLNKRGWLHSGQQGPVGVYKRDGKPIYVRVKKFTPRYLIFQADRQP